MRIRLLVLVAVTTLAGNGCSEQPSASSSVAIAENEAAVPGAEIQQEEPAVNATPAAASFGQPVSQETLKKALREKNPGFDGEIQVGSDGTRIWAIQINDPAVEDISPLAGLKLQVVDLTKTRVSDITPLKGMPVGEAWLGETDVADLAPLRGAPLEQLNLVRTRVTDLSPLEGAPIRMLWLNDTAVSDISPLRAMPLESLTLAGTKVSDLGPLKGHPVQRLHIARSEVTDLTPLRWMRLSRFVFTPSRIKTGMQYAREMSTLQEIGTAFGEEEWGISGGMMAPAVFWERYDAGQID